MPRNRVRIIAGQWRGRWIIFPAHRALRPTPDRVRETLFNWLQTRLMQACCLDAFAGSGALGFEALSRGAKEVYAFEAESAIAKGLIQNAEKLEARSAIHVYQEDVKAWLARPATQVFDIIFLDPPYASNELMGCLKKIHEHGWLAPGGVIYVEHNEGLDFLLELPFVFYRKSQAGQVHFGLLQAIQ